MTRLVVDQTAAVVRERDPRRLRAMLGVAAAAGLAVAGVLGYVSVRVQSIRSSYELDDLRALRADAADQNRKLQLELASLRSYARVDAAARRLGLTRPVADQVVLAREFVPAGVAAAEIPGVRTASRAEDGPGASARP